MQNILSHLKNFNGETKDAFLRDSNGMMRGGDGPGTATSHCYREWGADKGIETYASIAAKACWSPGIKPTHQISSQPWRYCKEHIRALFPKNFFLDFFSFLPSPLWDMATCLSQCSKEPHLPMATHGRSWGSFTNGTSRAIITKGTLKPLAEPPCKNGVQKCWGAFGHPWAEPCKHTCS